MPTTSSTTNPVEVTLLFTDVEGSTGLFEQAPDAASLLIARHEALLKGCVETAGGAIFKMVGDGVCAAFKSPEDAARAALRIQEELTGPGWLVHGSDARLRVRMAIHRGPCEQRDGDYYGLALSQVARLLAAGHGGQILLSDDVASALREAPEIADSTPLPLTDLGEHGLRGLSTPIHIFQLNYPGGRPAYPPLKTQGSYPNNLPSAATRFFGRAAECERLKILLAERRLVTITGPGGSGKTRLALHVAEELLALFPAGAFLVELGGIDDGERVPHAIASAVGIREAPGQTMLGSVVQELGKRRCLVILDNCEHLIDGCAAAAQGIVQRCPSVTVLATSREMLSVAGETVLALAPLPVPDTAAGARKPETLEELAACDSVQLLIDRIAAIRPTFTLSHGNAPAVAQVCRRLEGIPLALELAAARVSALSIEQVAARMDDAFRLLTRGSRTSLPRQQTLRAVIDWSYDLLGESERALLRELSVFAGGWILEPPKRSAAGAEGVAMCSIVFRAWSRSRLYR